MAALMRPFPLAWGEGGRASDFVETDAILPYITLYYIAVVGDVTVNRTAE